MKCFSLMIPFLSWPFAAQGVGLGDGGALADFCAAIATEARRAAVYRDVGLDYGFYRSELVESGRGEALGEDLLLEVGRRIYATVLSPDDAEDFVADACRSGLMTENEGR